MTRTILSALVLTMAACLNAPGAQSQRAVVLAAMSNRPTDPWPRGQGHVLLGMPGAPERAKAYHEPGGSFSPAVGTFGVSFWITGPDHSLVTTSDGMPLAEVQQRYAWDGSTAIPGIATETPYYRALWSYGGDGIWQLTLSPKLQHDQSLSVLIRSVGPAGGPIHQLHWSGSELRVNDNWNVMAAKPLILAAMGHEGDAGWLKAVNHNHNWQGADGWGYARFELNSSRPFQLTLRGPAPNTNLPFTSTKSSLDIQLPDSRFAESLNDQVANLMMSTVRNETRPGEPVNYPLAWLRDGAYTLTALARAGRIDTARAIAQYFAEHDFFGGFGPEADAPGLSLWALEEVALRAHDPAFDHYLWPHVVRKTELIHTMRHTTTSLYREPYGPIVPQHRQQKDLNLLCEPSRNGLIIGRMDWHRPILFINAVSYRGLLSAADLADRLHHPEQASAWRAEAGELQEAWLAAFPDRKLENDRTYISALWPTGVAGKDKQEFESRLAAYWSKSHDSSGNYRETPLWTYFNIAEAHQWLLLNKPNRAWSTVDWFWSHQASPGLYTWWEGKGEENTFHGWDEIRGWVHPAHVTPHYWTAAEMLLLQMDMLAYKDHQEGSDIVVGAGVKPEWLNGPMRVTGAPAGAATVDWNWNQKRLIVKVHRSRLPIRLGPAFPPGTPLEVSYEAN